VERISDEKLNEMINNASYSIDWNKEKNQDTTDHEQQYSILKELKERRDIEAISKKYFSRTFSVKEWMDEWDELLKGRNVIESEAATGCRLITKYEQLTENLKEAYQKSKEAVTGDDGGTANLDSTFLILTGWSEEQILKAIKAAGLYCRQQTDWMGRHGYLISTGGGQGEDRTRARNAFSKCLKEKEYKVMHFDMID